LSELATIVDVPPGFTLTAEAYREFVRQSQGLMQLITELDDLSDKWIMTKLNVSSGDSTLIRLKEKSARNPLKSAKLFITMIYQKRFRRKFGKNWIIF